MTSLPCLMDCLLWRLVNDTWLLSPMYITIGWRLTVIGSWGHVAAACSCILVLQGWYTLLNSVCFNHNRYWLTCISRITMWAGMWFSGSAFRWFSTSTNSSSWAGTVTLADQSVPDIKDLPTLVMCFFRLVNWACIIARSSRALLSDWMALTSSLSVVKRHIPW